MPTKADEQSPNDATIAHNVKTKIELALLQYGHAEDSPAISVTMDNGTLTLSGQVHSRPELQAVLDTARSAPGVTHVINHIMIGAPLERDSNDRFIT